MQNSFWIANSLMRVHMCSLMFFRDKDESRGKGKARLVPVSPLAKRPGFVRGICDRLCTRCDSARVDLRLSYAKQSALAGKRARPGPPRGGEYFTRIYVAFHAANTLVV